MKAKRYTTEQKRQLNKALVTRLKALAEASKKDIGDGEGNPGKNVRKAAYIDMKDAVTLTKRP